ncbi:MAG: DUF1232 domain-containing protein [Sneathiella sp.]|nr:DUF1232 domain-containing protein [Sneathiella sp.]
MYLAMRGPRVSWFAKALAAIVAGYAFGPIDLIPDLIPIIGYLDDAILLPLGILLVIHLISAVVFNDLRQKAATHFETKKPQIKIAAVVILLIWLLLAVAALQFIVTPTTP